MIHSYAKFDENGWGVKWFRGNDADPRETRGYIPVPESLRGEDVKLLKATTTPATYDDDGNELTPEITEVTLETTTERLEYDRSCLTWDQFRAARNSVREHITSFANLYGTTILANNGITADDRDELAAWWKLLKDVPDDDSGYTPATAFDLLTEGAPDWFLVKKAHESCYRTFTVHPCEKIAVATEDAAETEA
jgi:hypothetical protein